MQQHHVQQAFNQLLKYCETEGFKGWDPYDGLNSRLFRVSQLHRIRFFRLAWIQLFKRNPINLRSLTLVPKEFNPKGLGLFLSGYCNLYTIDQNPHYLEKIHFLANTLIDLRTKGYSGSCWGYNFDWQSRAFFLPKGTPTVVATSFIAMALLDAYEITQEPRYLKHALSSADFILHDLNRTPKKRGFIFSYSPYDQTAVYNASLLGSKLLARIFNYTQDPKLKKIAKASIQACVDQQRHDGAWIYGELKIQDWVDSFHTGYNLEAIATYEQYTQDKTFHSAIKQGLEYYLNNFFLEDGCPKYYDNQTYPIDIHAPAQFMVTLSRLKQTQTHQALLDRVVEWTLENMQDPKGYFYYQLKPLQSSKIPYMRWAQAWMFYGLSFYLKDCLNQKIK